MRELVMLFTIILGQLAPNSHLLVTLEEGLKLPQNTTSRETVTKPSDLAIANPIKQKTEDYSTNAQSIYSIDIGSNTLLASKDTEKRLPIASLTKLMTAYVIIKEEIDLGKVISVPNLTPQLGDSTMGLTTGDKLTTRDLLDGLLITSGSDAAQTLAVDNAGSSDAFVVKMNNYANKLDLSNTHFANPVGWDSPDNYSSAKDITELTRILLRSDVFRNIIKTDKKTISIIGGRQIALNTTNQLLGKQGYIGVKTGYTLGAGECLISLYKEGETEILTTVIGSGARFLETENIKGWIFDHFSW